jgi:hypothetical protein
MTTQKLIASHQIPMPAITICSPIVMRKKSFDFSEYFKKIRKNNFKSFGDVKGSGNSRKKLKISVKKIIKKS